MKFEDAMWFLFKGEKIRRKYWSESEFLSSKDSFSIDDWNIYDDWETVKDKKYYVVFSNKSYDNKISHHKYKSLESFKIEFPEFIPICLLNGYSDDMIISPKDKKETDQ